MNAGDIKSTLTLENGSFKVELQKAGVLLKQFERNLEQTSKSVKKIEAHTASFSARMRYAITSISLARGALSNLNVIFLGLPTAIASASGEIERMQKLMTGLAKSSQDVVSGNKAAEETAQGWTSYIFELSKNAPFEVNAISDSFVKLKTAGLDPTSGSLEALVDSVAKFGGTSEQLKRASVAIQQMGGKGVISMEELRQQLGEAVPDAMQNMAVGTGMSMAELVKAISKGTVESSSALDRMFTVMKIQNEGAAAAMVDTWTGQLAKLKTQFTLFLNEAGNAGGENSFFSTIKQELKELNALFDTPEAKKFASELGRGLTDVTKNLAATVKFVAEFSSEIKAAAQAMIVFWAASKGVAIYQEIARRFAAAKEAAMAYQAAQAALAAREVQEEINKNNEIIRNLAIRHAKMKAMQEKANAEALARRVELDRIEQRQGYIGTLGRNYREVSNDAARLTANAAAMGASAERLRQMGIETARLNAEKATLIQRIMSTTTKLPILGTALNMLGGPIGIITTLITAGAFAWFEWGRNAKEAIDSANSALKQGTASQVDVATFTKQLEAQKKVLKEFEAQNSAVKLGVGIVPISDAQINAQKAKILEIEKNLAQAKKQARNNDLQESVRLNQKYNDVFLDQSKTRHERELAALKASTEKQKAEAEKAGKSLTEIEQKYSVEFKRISQERLNDRSKYLQSSINLIDSKIAKETSEVQRKAFEEQKANLTKIKNEIDADLAAVGRLGSTRINSATDPNAGADTRVVKLSPIDKFIEKLKEEQKQVESNRETLLEGKKVVKDYLAELEVGLDAGKFTGKKSGAPSKEKMELAKSLIAQLKIDKTENDQLSKYNEFMKEMEGRIAGLNAELSKNNGEGAVARLFKDLKDSGIVGEKLQQATAEVEKFQQAFEAKNIDQAITNTQQNIAVLKEKIEGGSSAVAKLNIEIERLGKANLNEDNLKELERLRTLAKEQERLQSEDTLRDLRFATDARVREVREGNATEAQLVQLRYEQERAEIERTFQLSKVYGEARLEAEKLMTIQLKALEERRAQQLRSPAERMVRQWEDATQRMREASADWTNDFIDKLAEGNLKFGDFVEQMLMDIYKIALRKQLGGAVQGVFDAIANGVGGAIDGSGSSTTNTLVDSAKSGFEKLVRALGFGEQKVEDFGEGVAESAVETAIQTTNSASVSAALQAVAQAAVQASAALNQLAASGGSSSIASSGGGGFFDGIFGAIGDFFGSGGYEPLPDFVPAFANGGIMTKFGQVPLRAYSNGGIATRPQMALYGEGSRPEAFVPLPDGRTIPVTIAGGIGGGSNVVVNVIGAPEGTRTEKSQNADGSMNIDVIIGQVEGKISQNVSKGKGSLSQVMEKTYGLNRVAGAY